MIVEVLTKRPKLLVTDYCGYNCLQLAIKNGNLRAVELILGSVERNREEKKRLLNHLSKGGITVLHLVVKYYKKEIAELIMKYLPLMRVDH